jgi:hypothetical protein
MTTTNSYKLSVRHIDNMNNSYILQSNTSLLQLLLIINALILNAALCKRTQLAFSIAWDLANRANRPVVDKEDGR